MQKSKKNDRVVFPLERGGKTIPKKLGFHAIFLAKSKKGVEMEIQYESDSTSDKYANGFHLIDN